MAIPEGQEKVVARADYYHSFPPERTYSDHARLGAGPVYLFAVLTRQRILSVTNCFFLV